MKDNKPQPDNGKGVRYVGDGSWGVPEDACPTNHTTPYPENFQYFEKEHPNHIWKVRLFKNSTASSYSIEYKAIDLNNTVVFETTDVLWL